MDHSRFLARIDAVIRFFFYVLIFWLPYSPAVIESCVVVCFILWLFKRNVIFLRQGRAGSTFRERLRGLGPEPGFLNRPIAFFLLACVLSVAGSAFFAQSLRNFFTKTLEWFIIYFLAVEVFKDKRHVYTALAVFMFTAVSTVVDSLIQFHVTGKDIFLGHVIVPGSRATAGFKTPNGLGAYLTGVIPLAGSWFFFWKQKFRGRLAALSILLLALWSLAVTFSRGAWLGAFLGTVFLLLVFLLHKKTEELYFSAGLFFATVILCISFFLILTNSTGREWLGRHETIGWRMDIWEDSVRMIKDKPLFGHGINTFMRNFESYRRDVGTNPTYAHNCYIQLAAETGIAGLVCFLWIMAGVFRHSLERIRIHFHANRNLAVLCAGLLSGILAFLVHSFFDTNWYSLQLSVYLWVMIGLLVAAGNILDGIEGSLAGS